MHNNTADTDTLIFDLVKAIYQVGGGRAVSWAAVAKVMEGSEEYAVMIGSLAQLPEAQPYFRDARYSLALSERGVLLARRLLEQPADDSRDKPLVQQIAAAVKSYAIHLSQLRLTVESVSAVAYTNKRYVQAVTVRNLGDDFVLPTETPVTLYHRNASAIMGRVVGVEPDLNVLYIAFEREARENAEPVKLSVDRAFLLRELVTSIEMIGDLPKLGEPLLNKLSDDGRIADQDSVIVADELAGLRPPWTRFLWGPPGSGKTYALGRLIIQLLKRERDGRVLLVAPSNLAADVALEQFLLQVDRAGLGSLLDNHEILRYGYPRKQSILSQPQVLGPQEVEGLADKIKSIAAELARAEREQASEARLSVLRAELLERQESLRRLVAEHLENCRLIVATTTMAYLRTSPLSQMKWDTVLVDEVTMVPPAVCVYLSSRATSRLLLAGDPRQLAPVFEANKNTDENTKKWMGRDIFDVAGVSSGEGEARTIATRDVRLTRITSQRRCTTSIWKEVASLYPAVTNLVDETRNGPLRALPPVPNAGIVLADMGGNEGAGCERVHYSWRNLASGELALMLAKAIREESAASIALIAPYRAQVRLWRRMMRGDKERLPLGEQVETGTIHQFQGSEADVVIFDLVDGPGRKSLGALLRGDAGIRLMTVAITRARGKCIIIADRGWCLSKVTRAGNPLLWSIVRNVPSFEFSEE